MAQSSNKVLKFVRNLSALILENSVKDCCNRNFSTNFNDIREQKKIVAKSLSNYSRYKLLSYIAFELSMDLRVLFAKLRQHPKSSLVPGDMMVDSLWYLQAMGFHQNTIAESVVIILYPKKNIENGFQRILDNEEVLQSHGIIDGLLIEKTGTKDNIKVLRDLRLQLCLYYMELPVGFNGCGIF